MFFLCLSMSLPQVALQYFLCVASDGERSSASKSWWQQVQGHFNTVCFHYIKTLNVAKNVHSCIHLTVSVCRQKQIYVTHEQQQILNHDIQRDHVVKIMAFAGKNPWIEAFICALNPLLFHICGVNAGNFDIVILLLSYYVCFFSMCDYLIARHS